MKLPRILIIDDEIAVDRDKQDDLLNDTATVKISLEASDDELSEKARADTVAGIAFCRGQEVRGEKLYNDYSVIRRAVGKGWGPESKFQWSLVLLDVMFVSGDLRSGVPLGRDGDKDFGERILADLLRDFPGVPVLLLTSKHEADLSQHADRHLSKDGLTHKELSRAMLRDGTLTDSQARKLLQLPDDIVVHSRMMWDLFCEASGCANSNANILLLGETGVGKEVLAQFIHDRSRRGSGPFVARNVAAFTDTLVESELFGHEKGSFTGATERRIGAFEHAKGGTLFLDEIGDMAPNVQQKVLRALESRKITRVGGKDDIEVDIRLVSATSRNLSDAVDRGEFRKDLFYRLNTVELVVPPLRERPDDITPLAEAFLDKFMRDCGKRGIKFADDATHALRNGYFPGNVRELRNLIEKLVIDQGNNSLVSASDLDSQLRSRPAAAAKTGQEAQTSAAARQQADLGRISLMQLAEIMAGVEVSGSVEDDGLNRAWTTVEREYLHLVRRMAGAALATKSGDATAAMNLLRVGNGKDEITNQKARQLINGLLGREKNAPITGELDVLIKLWRGEISSQDLPPVELSYGQRKDRARRKPNEAAGDVEQEGEN